MSALRPVWVVFAKDLRIELRRRESLASMAFFGALVLVILSLAVGGGRRVAPETGGGILWVAVLFAAVLGLGRVFAREKEDGCVSALLVSPLSPGALFAAKALVNFSLMAAAEVVLVPLFFVLFGRGLAGNPLPLLPVIVLVNGGFSAAGTLLSAVAAGTRRNEVLLPILLYPLLLPVIVLAVRATGGVLAGGGLAAAAEHLPALAAFCAIYAAAGALLFPFAVREG